MKNLCYDINVLENVEKFKIFTLPNILVVSEGTENNYPLLLKISHSNGNDPSATKSQYKRKKRIIESISNEDIQ